jgi:lipopolysaccharide/colanic/teichoic acid biosynthesis glycosyltransferase
MLLIAAAIALENRGPIVFVQYRIGRNGRSFRMLKFRTLPDHADDGCRRVLTRYDARLTALARFLRETGLDELPQLVNVIGGTMSLVGPRPLVEADAFACIKPCAERFLVPPGITGLAQVRGRNSVPLLKRLRDDALYIRRRSLRLDMLILIQTLLVPFSPDNAYPCGSTVRNADRGMN